MRQPGQLNLKDFSLRGLLEREQRALGAVMDLVILALGIHLAIQRRSWDSFRASDRLDAADQVLEAALRPG